VLRFYAAADDPPAPPVRFSDPVLERVHARSRFRSLGDRGRLALYSVHDADGAAVLPFAPPLGERSRGGPGRHTLIAVREFRRVPLDAASLALTVFTARPGRAVPVVAALAHFVERAVDLYQPGYLLLAHSLEEPRTSLLLTAVRDSLALGPAATAAFALDEVLPELDPLLEAPPECYEYCPETETALLSGAVSPYAV
jgi:hypothetical protein